MRQKGSSYHKVSQINGGDNYSISWTTNTQQGRLRNEVLHDRTTDKKGAERFSKKWGVSIIEST